MSKFWILITINAAIIALLFVISWNFYISAFLVFSIYGIVVSVVGLKQNWGGIINSFNGIPNLFGMMIAMKVYGPKSVIMPFVPKDGIDNVKFNSKSHKISSGFSFLFWLLSGLFVETILRIIS